MAATFPQEAAAMSFQMPNQIDALHARLGAQPLPNHGDTSEFFFRQRAIGVEHQFNRFTKIRSRFVERFALRIRAGQFLDERDVPPPLGLHGRQRSIRGTAAWIP
jgi:hypothetical protein